MSINVSEVIWTIVCFFVLLFVLKKFLFDPLIKFMDQRQANIDQSLKKGREARQRKDESDAALRESWKECGVEAKQLLAEGKASDEKERAWCWQPHRRRRTRHCWRPGSRIDRERSRCGQMPQSRCPNWLLPWCSG